MFLRRRSLLALAALAAAGLASPAVAAETQVAVAANFTEAAKEIAAAFTAATGHRAILAFGSSGQFYSQITHGAPYEVFLSADAERPKRAEREGLGVAFVPVGHRARRAGQSKYTNLGRLLVSVNDLLGVRWLMRRHRGAAGTEEL